MKKVKIYKGKHTVFLPGLANILKDNPLGLLWCGFILDVIAIWESLFTTGKMTVEKCALMLSLWVRWRLTP